VTPILTSGIRQTPCRTMSDFIHQLPDLISL
jgi:hypothetical protein